MAEKTEAQTFQASFSAKNDNAGRFWAKVLSRGENEIQEARPDLNSFPKFRQKRGDASK